MAKAINSAKLIAHLKHDLSSLANALVARSRNFTPKIYKYYPYPSSQAGYKLNSAAPVGRELGTTDFPVPPQDLRPGYGSTVEDWLSGGKRDIDTMLTLVTSPDFDIREGSRILDLGCQSGRMIRWLANHAAACEIWGVDVSARHIVWCQENMSPPFNFATVTTLPHLPFEDNYFDLVYCGSVFTHIDDLSDAWLLEVKRIMRKGGRAYITVHDNHTLEFVLNRRAQWVETFRDYLLSHDKKLNFTQSSYYKFCIAPGTPDTNVFYDIDYLRQHWGRVLQIVSVTPEAYGYQTAVVMQK